MAYGQSKQRSDTSYRSDQFRHFTNTVARQLSETIEPSVDGPTEKLQRFNHEPLTTSCVLKFGQVYQDQPHRGGWMVHFVAV